MEPVTFRKTEEASLARLAMALEERLRARGAPGRPVVFACIGTDRSTGDALGPLVGERLLRLGCEAGSVIGSLERPLHALNLSERLSPRLDARPSPLVVAVDAALGPLSSVGSVTLRGGGIRPGNGVGKDLPEVGELSLTAAVNVQAGQLDAQVLQSTRLWLVKGLAERIEHAVLVGHAQHRPRRVGADRATSGRAGAERGLSAAYAGRR